MKPPIYCPEKAQKTPQRHLRRTCGAPCTAGRTARRTAGHAPAPVAARASCIGRGTAVSRPAEPVAALRSPARGGCASLRPPRPGTAARNPHGARFAENVRFGRCRVGTARTAAALRTAYRKRPPDIRFARNLQAEDSKTAAEPPHTTCSGGCFPRLRLRLRSPHPTKCK